MNYYPFHIGDYATHARNFSLMEDLAYRRLLDLYYTNEDGLPLDIDRICRLIGMREYVQDVTYVLSEFFLKSETNYRNRKCDEVIAEYQAKSARAKNANSARWKSDSVLKSDLKSDVISDLKSETFKIPTNNQEPITNIKANDADTNSLAEEFPLADGSAYRIPEDLLGDLKKAHPRADVSGEILKARLWCIANPTKRKTFRGMPKFLAGWMDTAPKAFTATVTEIKPAGGRVKLA